MARQDFRIGKMFGVEIGVSLSWFVIYALVTVLLATAYFPTNYKGLPRYEYLALGLITSTLFFASVLFHELMHSVVARARGISIRKITLFIFGGVAQMDHDAENPLSEFLMAIAGPAASLVLAALFGTIFAVSTALGLPVLVTGPAFYLAFINFYLAVFNLVPGFPLDGGRVLRSIIWGVTKDIAKATRIASWAGQAFALVLIGTGILMFLAGQNLWLNGVWFVLIGMFLWQVAAAGYEQVVLQKALTGVTVADVMTKDVIKVGSTVMVDELVNEYFMKFKHSRFPVLEDEKVIGVVTLHDVRDRDRQTWEITRTRAITPPLASEETVEPDLPAESAIGKIGAAGRGHLLVMKGDKMVGIVTINDLIGAIELRKKLGVKHE
jgi:Zn-dependent protease/CBS domain-containing protein